MAFNEALVTIMYEEEGTACEYPLPEPSTYSGSTSTMVDSGTSVSGHLLGSIVRDNVAQISLSWNYLRIQDWAQINQLFKKAFINKVRFFDQTMGDWVVRDVYISDLSAGMWRRDSSGSVLGWTGCNLQLTEV